MEKNLTIKLKITEGFVNKILSTSNIRNKQDMTFDERANIVISSFLNPLYQAMADYATQEQKAILEEQSKLLAQQAVEQSKQLVEIIEE